ncbi:MAG: hydroxyacid dehydrogenase, partial [Polaromonas sp.]|nr:hydroxyacid dehydrogenase [Polaromonas sp.]
MSEKIPLLVLNTHSEEHQSVLSKLYDLAYAPTEGERAAAIAAHGAKFRAVLTIGVLGLTAREIAAM